MIRKLIELLMVLLIVHRGTAFYSLNVINLNTTLHLGEKILHLDSLNFNVLNLTGYASSSAIDIAFNDITEISSNYDAMMVDINKKHPGLFQLMSISVNRTDFNNSVAVQIRNLISRIDLFYDNAVHIRKNNISHGSLMLNTNSTFESFDGVRGTLIQIRNLLFPPLMYGEEGYLDRIIVYANKYLPYYCDKFLSDQQRIYLTYIKLLLTELKGLITQTYHYLIISDRNPSDNYDTERKIVKNEFESRVTNYYRSINNVMTLLPRQIQRCEVNPPLRGVNFLEFVKYHRAELYGVKQFDKTNCLKPCERLYMLPNRNSTTLIGNCHNIGPVGHIDVCYANSDSSRKYVWWKSFTQNYGRIETCTRGVKSGMDTNSPAWCRVCTCSTMETVRNETDGRVIDISLTPQVSDISNNKIVVGIQFVKFNDAIHLQVMESRFMLNETYDNYTWKEIDKSYTFADRNITYRKLSDMSGQIYLDDIILPPQYAVTGVKFEVNEMPPRGFFLQVQGTRFDYRTGELDPESTVWFVTGDFGFSNINDYKRERIQILVDDTDDPTRCRGYYNKQETNKFIRFHHSSVVKDAGQSTVPYLDAQPVGTYPPFPLSGVGLFYREKDGCGGYIAPRIFTVDISNYT